MTLHKTAHNIDACLLIASVTNAFFTHSIDFAQCGL